MNRQLIEYYEQELRHLREMGEEFAAAFPHLASRLSLDEFGCQDPYVERLLEGFAFLAARIHLKMDAQFPRLTEALLDSVYPHALAPTPSMAIVQFEPDLSEGSLAAGFNIPRGTSLRSSAPARSHLTSPCEFRTAHSVSLFPLRISEAQYHATDLSSLGLPGGIAAKSALRIRIETTISGPLSAVKMDELAIHIRGAADLSGKLYEQIFARGGLLVTRSVSPPVKVLEVIDDWREAVGYSDAEAILPYDARSFQGYRLLREYFTLPERFMFARIKGLIPSLQKVGSNALELIIAMSSQEPQLESLVSADNFALYCTPVVNLFRREADRIHLTTHAAEFPVVVDRTRPRDFEVYQVQRVTGFRSSRAEQQEFRPFYATRDHDGENGANGSKAYFSAHRTPRASSEREKRLGRRSAYSGSEIWISLVDSNNAPYRTDLRQVAVEALCTNRDLPEHLQPNPRGESDFTWELGGPINSARLIAGPTAPRESCSDGERAWRLVSHMCLNYLSLVDVDNQQGASALRELLRLYVDTGNRQHERQIEGVRSILAKRITRRVPSPGPIVFARGLELTLMLDDSAFEGAGVYPFGSVLQHFFGRYVSINSFVETVLQTRERGQVMRWLPMIGLRNLL